MDEMKVRRNYTYHMQRRESVEWRVWTWGMDHDEIEA